MKSPPISPELTKEMVEDDSISLNNSIAKGNQATPLDAKLTTSSSADAAFAPAGLQVISPSRENNNKNDVNSDSGGNDAATSESAMESIGADDKTTTIDISKRNLLQNAMAHSKDGKNQSTVRDNHPEKQKILELLSHRRLLLKRLAHCRLASETRLRIQQKAGEKETFREGGIKTGLNAGKDGTVDKVEGGSLHKHPGAAIGNQVKDELTIFREMCSYAMQYKPVRVLDRTTSEPSRTLRKGASVGKNMRAAVATLTSNSGWISDSSSSNTNQMRQKQVLPTLYQKSDGTNIHTAGIVPSNPSIVVQSQIVQPPVRVSKKSAMSPPPVPDNVQSSYHHATLSAPPPAGLSNVKYSSIMPTQPPPLGKQTKTKKLGGVMSPYHGQSGAPQKLKRSNSTKSMRGINTIGSSSEIPPPAKTPLHHGLNAETEHLGWTQQNMHGKMLPNTDLNMFPSRVLCPETEKLRVKKRDVDLKLESLFRKRYAAALKGEMEGIHSVRSAAPFQKANKKMRKPVPLFNGEYQSSHGKVTSRRHAMEKGLTPFILPERRKTQWDCVLQEMRWLATDFIEERKWKSASAHVISSEILARNQRKSCQTRLSQINPTCLNVASLSPENASKMATEEIVTGNSTNLKVEQESIIEDEVDASDPESGEDRCQLSALKYESPSDEDIKRLRSISKLCGMIVEEHWNIGTEKIGTHSHDCDYLSRQYGNIFRRYRTLRQSVGSIIQKGGITEEKSHQYVLLRKDKPGDNDSRKVRKGLTHDEITKDFERRLRFAADLYSNLKQPTEKLVREFNDNLKRSSMELCSNQIHVMQYIEELWKRDGCSNFDSGAVISGPEGSGKTISTGALLWRERMRGPQLLLCSPKSVIRWRHELGRFRGLNVFTSGQHGWSYDMSSSVVDCSVPLQYKPGDVFVCEFSRILGWNEEICKVTEKNNTTSKFDFVPFATVVIDTRCMRSYSSASLHNKISRFRKKKLSYPCRFENGFRNIPNEVISCKWWNDLILSVISDNTRCVLVEGSASIVSGSGDPVASSVYTESGNGTELLSYKVAFLHHQVFRAENVDAFGKRAFSWAKKHLYQLKERAYLKGKFNSEQAQPLFSVLGGTRGILIKSVKLVTHLGGEIALLKSEGIFDAKIHCNAPRSLPEWSIRLCPLAEAQRKAYERSCSFLRGAFSCGDCTSMPLSESFLRKVDMDLLDSIDIHGIPCADVHLSSAKALLRLRRDCFHSDLLDLVNPVSDENRLASIRGTLNKKLRPRQPTNAILKPISLNLDVRKGHLNSPSQPNIELAKSLSDNSSKLKELQSILVNECGYISGGRKCYKKSDDQMHDKIRRQKVLILAALPEVLLLTSIFLNSIGISNELLMSVAVAEEKEGHGSLDDFKSSRVGQETTPSQPSVLNSHNLFQAQFDNLRSLCSWARCQQAIARFDTLGPINGTGSSTVDLIVSSPATLGSMSLGLCASNADVVISMDEDWSGRGDLHICSILMKCRSRQHNLKSSRRQRFIKLVSEGTCEHVLLTVDCKSKKCKHSVSAVPISMASITNSLVDSNGNLVVRVLPTLKEGNDQHQYFGCLLGSNVFRMHDVPLSNVLSTTDPLTLVPVEAQENKKNVREGQSGCCLVGSDDASTFRNDKAEFSKLVECKDTLRNAVSFGMALTKSESSSIRYNSFNVATICLPSYSPSTVKSLSSNPNMAKCDAGSFSGLHLVLSSRDVISKGIQIYVQEMKEIVLLSGASADAGHNLSTQPIRAAISNVKCAKQEAHARENKVESGPTINLRDFSLKQTSLATSLLVYPYNGNVNAALNPISVIDRVGEVDEIFLQRSPKRKKRIVSSKTISPDKRKKINTHVPCYSQTQVVQDGNQGRESLLYFPLIFPNSLESINYSGKEGVTESSLCFSSTHSEGKKRKTAEPLSSSKKLRKLNTPDLSMSVIGDAALNLSNGNTISSQQNLLPSIAPDLDFNLMTENEPDFMDTATSLFDSDEFLPDLMLKKDEVEIEKEANTIEIDEEFETLGAGDVFSINDPMISHLMESVHTNAHSFWLDPFEPVLSSIEVHPPLCDPEEASNLAYSAGYGAFLDAMILNVKARTNRSYDEQMQQHFSSFSGLIPSAFVPQHTIPFVRSQSLPMATALGYVSKDVSNGDLDHSGQRNGGLKKKKKNSQKLLTVATSLSFPRSSTVDVLQGAPFGTNSNIPMGRGLGGRLKDVGLPSRNFIGKNRKQGGIFAIINAGAHRGSPSVDLRYNLLYSLRVRENQMARIPQRDNVDIPLGQTRLGQVSDEAFLSHQPIPRNEVTARTVSKFQLNNLRNSFLVSSRVGFGPFSAGDVTMSNGHADVAPLHSRDGINLPMGVKVPHRINHGQHIPIGSSDEWSTQDDEQLKKYAAQFGLNFHITCRALTWNSAPKLNAELETCFDTETIRNNMRSARQCRDRLNVINPLSPTTGKMCLGSLVLPNKVVHEPTSSDFDNGSVLIHPRFASTLNLDAKSHTMSPLDLTKRTSRLKRGAKKRQQIPLTIPDCGSTIPTIVQSHQSHSQSVKSAVALFVGSSGLVAHRAEMWPLQFLDLVEKQQQQQQEQQQKQHQQHQQQQQQHQQQHQQQQQQQQQQKQQQQQQQQQKQQQQQQQQQQQHQQHQQQQHQQHHQQQQQQQQQRQQHQQHQQHQQQHHHHHHQQQQHQHNSSTVGNRQHEKELNIKQTAGTSQIQNIQKQGLHHPQLSTNLPFPPSNSIHSANHQKELVKQAARAAALASPSPRGRLGINLGNNLASPQSISIVSSSQQRQSIPPGSSVYGQNMHPGQSSGMGISSAAGRQRLMQIPAPVVFKRQKPNSHPSNKPTHP